MGWKFAVIVLLLAVVMGYVFSLILTPTLKTETPDAGDGWWAPGAPQSSGSKLEQDTSLRKFTVNVSNDLLADLNLRIRNARLIEPLDNSAFEYGFNAGYMRHLQQYWLENYSWRDAEKRLNQFDQFLTNIEGIDVHFLHVKPKLKPGQKAKPLIIVHGWPGSVYEFYKILPMLTDPTSHGGSSDDFFEVICPSIPGFGFSEAPHKQGFTAAAAARILNKLMLRLGFKQYYAQAGDVGTAITVNMAIMYPDNVKGLHNNDLAQVSVKSFVYPMVASFWPSFFLPNEEERNALLPLGERISFTIAELGYMYVFGTKPDSLAMALNDSPMGLASLILEKYSSWTNRNWKKLEDGGLTQAYSMDDLLTNVMIYWVNGNVASSVRLFKEEFVQVQRDIPLFTPPVFRSAMPASLTSSLEQQIG
eukprot:XP_792956.4 PREDICTED: LOW QUALITY PROTEIN: epoxide hydrolase 1 [Strongylocentrotus purpuratus]